MDGEFYATVKNGKMVWRRPHQAAEFVRSLEGKRVRVVFEEPTRTKAENRMIHALFNELSRRTGYSPAWWKGLMKTLYMADPEAGTSNMTIEEGSEFIEFCLAWAATEMGIVL